MGGIGYFNVGFLGFRCWMIRFHFLNFLMVLVLNPTNLDFLSTLFGITWPLQSDSNQGVSFSGRFPSRKTIAGRAAAMQFKAKLTKMEALLMVGSPEQ